MSAEIVGSAPVEVTVKITAEDMEDIACDAGMFGSWWNHIYYEVVDGKPYITANIADPGCERMVGRIEKNLSGDDIAKAIAKAIADGWDTKYPNGALAEFATTGEFGGGYDSVVADGILQYALLGNIVYG